MEYVEFIMKIFYILFISFFSVSSFLETSKILIFEIAIFYYVLPLPASTLHIL